MPEASRAGVAGKAREAEVLALWEAEHLSIREAAQELDLSYADFLDLLAAKGIPVARGGFDPVSLADARRKLAGGGEHS